MISSELWMLLVMENLGFCIWTGLFFLSFSRFSIT